jgi:hypothetical protein
VQADPGWAEDWKDPLFHILRDIAEPSGVDPHYTLTRYTMKKFTEQEANTDVINFLIRARCTVEGVLVLLHRKISVWGPKTHTPPPLHTVYVYTVYLREGGGGRVKPERKGEGQQFTKLGRKYQHNWLSHFFL